MNGLLVVHHTPTLMSKKERDLNVGSERGPVIFETSHLLLNPHSRGLGQQSEYWNLGPGSTEQAYEGLFNTMSQIKMKNK